MKIPVSPPPAAGFSSPDRLLHVLAVADEPTQDGKYRHWDTLRHVAPPADLTHEEWWFAIKVARRALYKELPFKDKGGRPFVYATPLPALEMLHRIDRDASGAIQAPAQVVDTGTRDTYLMRSFLEEAITSSQLEGASTTRNVAKAMIREGRVPRDRGERMIFNNYSAMQFMRQYVKKPLTPAILLELQSIVTDGTLEDSTAAGRLRRADDEIAVSDEIGTLLHMPPSASELPDRLQLLCDFANQGLLNQHEVSSDWIHPVVRAIVLHFMVGYDHPFADGNGRTARALFYWSMASQGYWLAEFVSISRILRQARARYGRAYLYTETDDNDTTYFILYQLRVFLRAIEDLHSYLGRKAEELRKTEETLLHDGARAQQLNERQLALMAYVLKHHDGRFTIESHRRSHGVSYETARSDLRDLAAQGLLYERKSGRAFVYTPVDDLTEKLAEP